MSRRGLVLAALAWLAVVAMTSAVTWAVINDAGQRVLSESSPAVQLPATDAAPAPSSPAGPTRHARPRHSRPPSPSPAPRSSAPSAAGRPTAPAPTPSSPSPSASIPSPAPTSQTGRSATWQGRPGSVTVGCAAGGASLESASPSDGYRVQVGGRGPGEVEVTFRGGGLRVQVTAGCASGLPRFRTEGEGSDN
jgi:hypothetical protein